MSDFEKIPASKVPQSSKYANKAWLDELAAGFGELEVGEALRFSLAGRYSTTGTGWNVSLRRALTVRGIPLSAFKISRPDTKNSTFIYLVRLTK